MSWSDVMMQSKSPQEVVDTIYTKELVSDFGNYLRIRIPVMQFVCEDEIRFLRFLTSYCPINGFALQIWDCVKGLSDSHGKDISISEGNSEDPIAIMKHIRCEVKKLQNNKEANDELRKTSKGKIFVLLDGFTFTNDPNFLRRLKDLALYGASPITVIVTSPLPIKLFSLKDAIVTLEETAIETEEYMLCIKEILRGVKPILQDIEKDFEDKKADLSSLLDRYSPLPIIKVQNAVSYSIVSKREINLEVIENELKKRQ